MTRIAAPHASWFVAEPASKVVARYFPLASFIVFRYAWPITRSIGAS